MNANAEHKIEIVTLHPTWVFGPTLISEKNSTLEFLARFLRNEIPGIVDWELEIVDIRDVATAHYLALITPGLNMRRFIISDGELKMAEIAKIYADEFS
jgi:nucleoside-diphosphate-sugar epimerase